MIEEEELGGESSLKETTEEPGGAPENGKGGEKAPSLEGKGGGAKVGREKKKCKSKLPPNITATTGTDPTEGEMWENKRWGAANCQKHATRR